MAVGRVVATGAEGRLRGCETITAADESSSRLRPPRGAIVGRLRLPAWDVYTATDNLSRESSLRACVYRCNTTANASTGAERLMLESGTTGPVGTVGLAGGLQVRIYYGCCDCVCKSAGRVRLWVRLGLERALVCESAALDVRTNYAFKAVGRLNAAVGRLGLRVNCTYCWSLSSLIYGRLTLRIT